MVQRNETFRAAIDDYFAGEVHGKEAHSISLLGCGGAGTELAGIFRRKPDFVPAYLPEYYPVRAFALDTQPNLSELLKRRVRWYEPQVQLNMTPPPEDRILGLLEQARAPDGAGDESTTAEPGDRGTFVAARGGGAGGFTLRGRASALYHFGEDSDVRRVNHDILAGGRFLSRASNGYLLTFSGLGGGTGSGAVPVVVEYIQNNLEPPPQGTFSLCIVPEETSTVLEMENVQQGNRRLLSNLLVALYYLASTPAINGIILSDNLQLERQGHRDLLRQLEKQGVKEFYRIDRYLQEVLMPVFLAAQAAYTYKLSAQLDPADVRMTMAPRLAQHQELIAVGFAYCPLPNRGRPVLDPAEQTIHPDPATGVPDLEKMLEAALENTTIQCNTGTARSVLALLSGPASVLERMVPDLGALDRFQRTLGARCLKNAQEGLVKFSLADFAGMTDVRLTVLLGAPEFPLLERALRAALDDQYWGANLEGESLADALRRLEEPVVRHRGLSLMY